MRSEAWNTFTMEVRIQRPQGAETTSYWRSRFFGLPRWRWHGIGLRQQHLLDRFLISVGRLEGNGSDPPEDLPPAGSMALTYRSDAGQGLSRALPSRPAG